MDQVPPAAHRPDWYPDPTGRFEFRYHNGQTWTGDVSVDGNRFLDPLTGQPVPRTVAQPTFAPQPFVPQQSSGAAKASFVLGVTSFLVAWVPFLCIVAIAAAVVGLVLGIIALRRESRARRDGLAVPAGRGYAVAGVVLAPLALALSAVGVWLTVLAIREVDDFTDVGSHHIETVSCRVVDGVATYTGIITNDSSEERSYNVTVEFQRPDTSVRLYIASTPVDDVAPGETAEFSVYEDVSEESLDCSIFTVTGPLPFSQS